MEDNIEDMLIRHRREITILRDNCPHTETTTVRSSSFETRIECTKCRKIIKRIRS